MIRKQDWWHAVRTGIEAPKETNPKNFRLYERRALASPNQPIIHELTVILKNSWVHKMRQKLIGEMHRIDGSNDFTDYCSEGNM